MVSHCLCAMPQSSACALVQSLAMVYWCLLASKEISVGVHLLYAFCCTLAALPKDLNSAKCDAGS